MPSIDSFGYGALIAFAVLLAVLILLLLREVACWYWKINKRVAQNEEIMNLLRKILQESNNTHSNIR